MNRFILYFVFVLFLVCLTSQAKASVLSENNIVSFVIKDTSFKITDTLITKVICVSEDSIISPSKRSETKKKIVSALFAFPFPFGFMGAHRVMLGTKPWVPIVYAATFGGCFGVLPLIDFFVIILSKDIEQYENNPHVFMWMK